MGLLSSTKYLASWLLMVCGVVSIGMILPIEDITTEVIVCSGLVVLALGGMLSGIAITEEKQG